MFIAGIVLYNPNIKRLVQNIKSVSNQVEKIILYNNGINEHDLSLLKQEISDNIIMLGNGENYGISFALNRIMEFAKSKGADWVITLDQDSICAPNMVEEYEKKINQSDVAIICPHIIDKNRLYTLENVDSSKDYYVKKCITSASCTRIEAWEDVEQFDEFLFIDLVDNDFCKRLILKQWKILKTNSVVLDQSFGETKLKSGFKVKFYMRLSGLVKNKNLSINIAKLSYKKKVSPLRVYYTNRNVLYLNKKFKNYGGIGYESYRCKSYFGFMIAFNLASLVRGKHKVKILSSIFNGIKDGLKSSPEKV